MNEDIMLSRLYRELADTLNISETMTNEIVKSYKAVGSYLGNMEPYRSLSESLCPTMDFISSDVKC